MVTAGLRRPSSTRLLAEAAPELADSMHRRGDPPPRGPYAPVPFDTLLPGG